MIRRPAHRNDHRDDPRSKRFAVKIGHFRLEVEGNSREQAIQSARRRLESELPRLWDVIASLDSRRFVVEELP